MPLINISDLKDPDDPKGRSYREVNNEKEHKYAVDDLIEIDGKYAFIARLDRDCDGTPLYSLRTNGHPEEGLKLITKCPVVEIG